MWWRPCESAAAYPRRANPRAHGSSGHRLARVLPRMALVNPAQLVDAIRHALAAAVQAGDLTVDVPTDIPLDRPRSREHGDYATPIALKLGKIVGRPPREIAGVISKHLVGTEGIANVEIAGPGFLNITLETAAAGALIGQIVAAGPAYGAGDALAGKRVNLEFVS